MNNKIIFGAALFAMLIVGWATSIDQYTTRTGDYQVVPAVVLSHDKNDHNRVRLRVDSSHNQVYSTSAGRRDIVVGSTMPVYFSSRQKAIYLENPANGAWTEFIFPTLMSFAALTIFVIYYSLRAGSI